MYEELAQAPSTSTARTLVAQAVAELHLGRVEEAEVALGQALGKAPGDAEALANMVVLETIAGREGTYLERLEREHPDHQFLADVREKAELFDRAAGKYAARVGA